MPPTLPTHPNGSAIGVVWLQLNGGPVWGDDPNGHTLTLWIGQPHGRPPAKLMTAVEQLRAAWCSDSRFETLLAQNTAEFIPEDQRPEGLVEGDMDSFHTEVDDHPLDVSVDAQGLWTKDFATSFLATIQTTLNQLLANPGANAGDVFFQIWNSLPT